MYPAQGCGVGLDDTDGSLDFFLSLIIFCVACLRMILVGFSPFPLLRFPPFSL